MSPTLIAILAVQQLAIAAAVFMQGRPGLGVFWLGCVIANVGMWMEVK